MKRCTDDAEQEQSGHDQEEGEIGVQYEHRVGREGRVHAEHDELALGEVDDPDDAEDQVQPDR